jgi:drug/metabolite transporter (DMT)-like permease
LSLLSLFLGLHFIFFTSAVKDTTILNATVLVNTTPIFSMFVSSLIYKLKPSRYAIFGLILSFMGICVIAYAESQSSPQTTGAVGFYPKLKGDVEAVLAAVVEAFYLNMGRKTRSQMNILSIMAPMYMLAAVVIGVIGTPVVGGFLFPPLAFEAFLALVGLGILPTAIAHTLYFSSLSNLKSFETAAMALLEPIGATILGIGLFQEIPEPIFALGAIFILTGIAFILTRRDPECLETVDLTE